MMKREHVEMNYYLTLAFTGNGCFKVYFKWFMIANTAVFTVGQRTINYAMNRFYACIAWHTERQLINEYLGVKLLTNNMIKETLRSTEKQGGVEYVGEIMKKKEEDSKGQYQLD